MGPAALAFETLRSLRVHALRFVLTGLGIAWGALMLTYLMSSVGGTARTYEKQVEASGERALYVFQGALMKERVGERNTRPVEIDDEDLDRLRGLHVLDHVSPNIRIWNRLVRTDRRIKLLNVTGADASLFDIRNFQIEEGRFFTPPEVEQGARVAVLGPSARERLFGREPAVGRTMRIDGIAFRVVGVTREKGQLVGMGGRDDRETFIPHTTARRWLTRKEPLRQLVAAPRDVEETPAAIRAIRMLMGLHHDYSPDEETALHFVSVQELTSILDALFLGFRVFLFATGIVTLAVGAVGVMNLMLVVVGERRREIGLRKALGAADRDIFRQFLAEATAVAVTAGALGTGLGWALVFLRTRGTDPADPYFAPPAFDPWVASGIFTSLVLVAVVAGVVPAVRAARTPPAESLHGS